jgi:hypothetical protein
VFLCIICIHLQQKKHKYVLFRYLKSITQALSAYFGLDNRECEYLEYLFIVFICNIFVIKALEVLTLDWIIVSVSIPNIYLVICFYL